MPSTNRLDEWIAWLQSSRARVDPASALAAGLGLSVMSIVLLNISVLRRTNSMDFIDVVWVVLMATVAYLIAALTIHWLWIKPLRRILPSWLMIACLGSLLIVVAAGALRFSSEAAASGAPTNMLQTLDFLSQSNGGYTRTKPPGSAGYGSPIGLIREGNGKIFSPGYLSMTSAEQTAQDAKTTVAELFHMAGRNEYYTDRPLAEAARSIPEYAAMYRGINSNTNVFDPRYTHKAAAAKNSNHGAGAAIFMTSSGNRVRLKISETHL